MTCENLSLVTISTIFEPPSTSFPKDKNVHICNKDGSEGGYIEDEHHSNYCSKDGNYKNCPVFKHLHNKCRNLLIIMMTDIHEEQQANLTKAKYKHICGKIKDVVGYIEDEHYCAYCSKDDNYKNCPTFKG